MAGLFVPLSDALVGAERTLATPREEWSTEKAEALLNSLKGVVSARVVARPGGVIDEVHLLTTSDVSAKQSVRNVESALRAHFDVEIDHRKVSVAQSSDEPGQHRPTVLTHPARRASEGRILFVGYQVEMERSHRMRIGVEIDWRGETYEGEASGADLPRVRLETTARATVQAIETAVGAVIGEGQLALSVDGVKVMRAFDEKFVLVAIHAIHGRSITALAGAATVKDTVERAVILGTLQATDRWVRGRI